MYQLETTSTNPTARFHSDTRDGRAAICTETGTSAGHTDHSAPIASLLLGLRYRVELTATEQTLLDDLAGPDGIAFLLLGQSYLHPAGAELFPLEEIRAAATAPIGTIFSQVKKARSRHQNDYLMMTVAISDQTLGRLLFGMLVPIGRRRDQTALDRFHDIARQFIAAESSIAGVTDQLTHATSSLDPWILVNRASGRTIAINSPAAGLLRSNPLDLIDCEFGALRERLGAVIGRGLTMTSFGDSLLPLCVVSIETTPLPGPEIDANHFLLEQMRNTLSGLRTAASHLHSTTCWKQEAEEADMAQLIEQSADDLDRHMHRLFLICDYELLEKSPVNVNRAVHLAAEQLRRDHPSLKSIHVAAESRTFDVAAPLGAIEELVKAVVQSHTRDFVDPADVAVVSTESASGCQLDITSTLSRRRRSFDQANGWAALIARLCRHLNAATSTQLSQLENTLTTTIHFTSANGEMKS